MFSVSDTPLAPPYHTHPPLRPSSRPKWAKRAVGGGGIFHRTKVTIFSSSNFSFDPEAQGPLQGGVLKPEKCDFFGGGGCAVIFLIPGRPGPIINLCRRHAEIWFWQVNMQNVAAGGGLRGWVKYKILWKTCGKCRTCVPANDLFKGRSQHLLVFEGPIYHRIKFFLIQKMSLPNDFF